MHSRTQPNNILTKFELEILKKIHILKKII